jgi:hypothetical protein
MAINNANTTPLSTVIGVFPDYNQANQAIDGLRQNSFSYDRIRLVERGTGNFMDNLKGMFTGQAVVASNTMDNLLKMGMPEYEARYYQNELDADHVLVLMNADDRPEQAFAIMRQNGAFDINSRLKMPLDSQAQYNQSQANYEAKNNTTTYPTNNAPGTSVQPDQAYAGTPAVTTPDGTHNTQAAPRTNGASQSTAAVNPTTSAQTQYANKPEVVDTAATNTETGDEVVDNDPDTDELETVTENTTAENDYAANNRVASRTAQNS